MLDNDCANQVVITNFKVHNTVTRIVSH